MSTWLLAHPALTGLLIVLLGLGSAAAVLGLRAPSGVARTSIERIREGLGAAPRAALLALIAWAALQVWAALHGWGPSKSWFGMGAKSGDPTPYSATALSTLAGLAFVTALGFFAFATRTPVAMEPARLSARTALVATLLSIFALFALLLNVDRIALTRLPLDVAIALPWLALVTGLAGWHKVRVRSAPAAQVAAPASTADAAAMLSGDAALNLLRRLAILGPQPASVEAQPARAVAAVASARSSAVWSTVAPAECSLPPRLLAWCDDPAARVLVPDLPLQSAHALIEAIAASAALRGERTIALVHDVSASARRLRAVFERFGLPTNNAIVAGLEDLERADRERSCPAICLVSLKELCALPARLLMLEHMRPLAACERLVLFLGDTRELSASDLCHFGLSLRTFAAVRAAEGASGGTWVMGEGTGALRDWLADTIGAAVAMESPGWPAAPSARKVWIGPMLDATRLAAISGQWQSLLAAGPAAALALDDRIGWHATSDHSDRPTNGVHASLRWILAAPVDLVAAVREASHRPAHEDCATVASLAADPVSHMLLDREVLWAHEAPQRRLPSIRANFRIALTHLDALLGAGALPEDALVWIFGADPVRIRLTERTPQPVCIGTKVVPALGDEGQTWSGAVWQVAGGSAQSPYRPTVTAAQVAYIDALTHRPVKHGDSANAGTRFPPSSIFSAHGRLYQVPAHARTAGNEITLAAAPNGARPNRPLLHAELSWKSWLAPPTAVQRNALRLAFARAEVEVSERVQELLPEGLGREHVIRIPAVEARFPSRACAIYLESVPSAAALELIRAVVCDLLPLFLAANQDDLHVSASERGLGPAATLPAILIYDRHPGGVGLAEALDSEVLWTLLRWAREVVARCPCTDGCVRCVPVHARAVDKAGMLAGLRGSAR